MAPAPGSTADAPKRPGPLPEALPRLGELHPAGLLLLAVAVLAAWPLFRYGIGGLATAWAKPEFSHGPVIPVLSFWMFLRELKAVPPVPGPVRDRWPGVALVALALGLALLGNLARLDNLIFYALILWIGGLVLVGFGWARGRLFWPSVLHLVFMLPLPQVLYWEVTTALQLVSSQIGVGLVRLAGVPVYLEGNVIDLGVWKLMVAEACSGLRYLFPIMSFTYVFAVLYRGPVVVKAALLLAAIPIAVLMNALRIGVIGLLVDRYGIAQAEGFLHAFEGWVVFLGCLVLLLGLAKLVQRLAGDRRRLGEALALDFSGLGAQAARIGGVVPSPALAATALLTAGLSAAFLLLPARGPGRCRRASPSSSSPGSSAPGPASRRPSTPPSSAGSRPTTSSPPSSDVPAKQRGWTSSCPSMPTRPRTRRSTRPRSACPAPAGRWRRSPARPSRCRSSPARPGASPSTGR